MKQFEFERNGYYKLVSIKDRQGNDRMKERDFYEERVGCITTDFCYDDYPSTGGLYRLNMTFVRNKDGLWANRTLHTSVVFRVDKTSTGFKVMTAYSVYSFEKAELDEPLLNREKNTIELYLSTADNYNFAKGFFIDNDGESFELIRNVHIGMFQDSVLLRFPENEKYHGFACRYFPELYGVTFYDTLYKQPDYSTPMRIHNTGSRDLEVKFEMFPHVWTIAPGESKRIIPYNSEGADVSSAGDE